MKPVPVLINTWKLPPIQQHFKTALLHKPSVWQYTHAYNVICEKESNAYIHGVGVVSNVLVVDRKHGNKQLQNVTCNGKEVNSWYMCTPTQAHTNKLVRSSCLGLPNTKHLFFLPWVKNTELFTLHGWKYGASVSAETTIQICFLCVHKLVGTWLRLPMACYWSTIACLRETTYTVCAANSTYSTRAHNDLSD